MSTDDDNRCIGNMFCAASFLFTQFGFVWEIT